jgi:hypothetical protein
MSMTTTAVLSPSSVVMRAARGSDGVALARLAALDSKRAPRGEVIVAEVDGAIQAALQLDDGATFADPFKPTAGLVELLELRAGNGEPRRVPRRGLAGRLRLRPAPHARAA